ncbi:MAG: glycosyl transferase, partial [Zetaproteobacteria bacterium]
MISVLAAFASAFALTGWFAGRHSPLRVLDKPSVRSLHTRPTPRTGGLAILAGIAVGVAMTPATHGFALLWWAALGVALVSFADDLWDLPPLLRLVVHFVAAAVVAHAALPKGSFWMFGVLTVALVWCINLYNFMDGMDGFAGG